jgi:Protein of unknown function (DUF541)
MKGDPMDARRLRTAVLAGALLAAFPTASVAASTITALGSAQVGVEPKNRNSNTSIARAVERAERAAVPLAIRDARQYAAIIARASGLTLGPLESVKQEISPFGFYFPNFGPNRYCGTTTRAIREGNPPRVVRRVKRRICRVPPFAAISVSVTFAATPAAAV